MGSQKWADDRLGNRIKVERENRGWSQVDMANMLSDNGIQPMHPTTVAKIEAGTRSVRINEAVGIADLFEVSLDSLLDRKPRAKRSDVTRRLDALTQRVQELNSRVYTLDKQVNQMILELPEDLDGAHDLKEAAYGVRAVLNQADGKLLGLVLICNLVLAKEEERLAATSDALMDSEVPEDEAQS